jgi:hypothetical protein
MFVIIRYYYHRVFILDTVTNCAFVISTIGEILLKLFKISPIVEMTKKFSL